MTDAVIVSTARTGLAKSWRGAFNMTHGATLGGHVVKHALLAEWRELLAAGGLTFDGLIAIRSRLDPAFGEFGCPCSRLLLGKVIERLAPLRGLSAHEDDLWPSALDDDAVWLNFAGTLPDSVADIDWHRW